MVPRVVQVCFKKEGQRCSEEHRALYKCLEQKYLWLSRGVEKRLEVYRGIQKCLKLSRAV